MTVLGVVIPAHDEDQLLGACLDALAMAISRVDVPVHALVVLDDCRDGSAEVCAQRGVRTVTTAERNAGRARRVGFDALLSTCTWIATTDADSRVAPDWLTEQLRLHRAGVDAAFGVVDIDDWSEHPQGVQKRFTALYGADDQHPHRHGACLGISRTAYLQVGGFPGLAVGEDRALARLLERHGDLSVVSSTVMRVITSARPTSRVDGGFATLLASLA